MPRKNKKWQCTQAYLCRVLSVLEFESGFKFKKYNMDIENKCNVTEVKKVTVTSVTLSSTLWELMLLRVRFILLKCVCVHVHSYIHIRSTYNCLPSTCHTHVGVPVSFHPNFESITMLPSLIMATLLKGLAMIGLVRHVHGQAWFLKGHRGVGSVCWGPSGMSLPSQSRPEDCGDLPPVLGAALLPAPLRLRHACRQVSAHCRRQPQAQVPRGERECPAAPRPAGCQPGQVLGSRCPPVSGMQWSGASTGRWRSSSEGQVLLWHLFHTLISSQLPVAGCPPTTFSHHGDGSTSV